MTTEHLVTYDYAKELVLCLASFRASEKIIEVADMGLTIPVKLLLEAQKK